MSSALVTVSVHLDADADITSRLITDTAESFAVLHLSPFVDLYFPTPGAVRRVIAELSTAATELEYEQETGVPA